LQGSYLFGKRTLKNCLPTKKDTPARDGHPGQKGILSRDEQERRKSALVTTIYQKWC